MKIKISKDTTFGTYYRDLYRDEIAEAMERFKGEFGKGGENTLLQIFTDRLQADDFNLHMEMLGMQVLQCDVEVDFAGIAVVDYDNVADTVASFTVNILAESYRAFSRVTFFCDVHGEPSMWHTDLRGNENRMYNVRLYEKTRDLWDEDWKAKRA